jgi:hypothetical protein
MVNIRTLGPGMHGQTITVTCPLCRRPVARLAWIGDRVEIQDPIHAENADPGGTLTSQQGQRPLPASRVVDVDAGSSPASSSSRGRKRIECLRRGHRRPQWKVVTQEVLDASYRRSAAEGTTRVSWLDLHS